MRRGAWDIDARVADMDLNGVYASLNFPSFLPGFAGQRLQMTSRRTATSRSPACGRGTTGTSRSGPAPIPGRIIPCQIPWLLDPELGAEMIRENAERGFKAVHVHRGTAPAWACRRSTAATGTRSSQACAETETVVNLHIGSSGASPSTSDDAPPDVVGVLFFAYAIYAAVDWLYSLVPVRYPDIKICLTRGRHRLGGRPARPARPHAQLPRHVRHVDRRPHARRGAAAELLVLRDRGPVARSRRATASASTTSSSRPTTRTATRPGPAPRTVRAEIGDLPAEDIRKITWEKRRASTATRSPTRCRPTRTRIQSALTEQPRIRRVG